MARRKMKDEARKVPLVSYTTESHADRVKEYVDREAKGATLSTWLLRLIDEKVPIHAVSDEPSYSNA